MSWKNSRIELLYLKDHLVIHYTSLVIKSELKFAFTEPLVPLRSLESFIKINSVNVA